MASEPATVCVVDGRDRHQGRATVPVPGGDHGWSGDDGRSFGLDRPLATEWRGWDDVLPASPSNRRRPPRVRTVELLRPCRSPAGVLRPLAKYLLGLTAAAVAFTVAGALTGGWGLVPVLTGSMRPHIQPGDAVFVLPESLNAVRVGQVLVFQPPGDGGAQVAHRVTSVTRTIGGTVIQTKGDANNVGDPWKARLGGTRAWRVVAVVPKIGYLSVAEHNRAIRLALEAVLFAAGIGTALGVIWHRSPKAGSPTVSSGGAAA